MMLPADLPADLTELSALALSQAIHTRAVSCREVMQAYLARIDAHHPTLNAIVSRAPHDTLLAQADACDAELVTGQSRGWLHGIPQAIKDTAHAAGFPTTLGSRVLAGAVARQDGLMVARMKAAGAIVIGKTNMPEFGLGSHTFNELFGATPNAWDPAVSAGGSSGGATVALAHRLLPVADGSDFMGSLRNPAAWNNLFGLRPSQGRVPYFPAADSWVAQLGTEGPLARNVADLAALLATQAGYDARVPLSISAPLQPHRVDAQALRGLRVAWLGDLQGYLPMDEGLLAVVQQGVQRLATAGADVQPATLAIDLDAVWRAWLVWRHALAGNAVAAVLALPGAREQIKPEALWEHEGGRGLTMQDFLRASGIRSALYAAMQALFAHADVIALPVTQTWPFPVGERWPKTIAGKTMDTYHRWMEVTLYATFAGLPAVSVPAGFHANGRWPAGLQLIGKPQDDAGLLRIAAAYEALIPDLLARRPAPLPQR